jgi:hypothetical protein
VAASSASAPSRRDDDIAAPELGEQRASSRTILDGDRAAHAFFDDNLANGQPVHEGVALDLAALDIEALTPLETNRGRPAFD